VKVITALIKKDLLLVWKCGAKVVIPLAAFYIVLPLISGVDESAMTVGVMLFVLCPGMQMSAFSLDEASHWNRYVLSAPVSRRQLVWSKYATAIVLSGIGEAFLAVYMLLVYRMGAKKVLGMLPWALLGGMLISVLFFSVMLPILFRFGSERGRFIFIVFCAAVGMGATMLSLMGIGAPKRWDAGTLAAVSIPSVLVLAALSVRISFAVCRGKEIK